MDSEIIQNKYLRVTINPDKVSATVQLTDGDIRWEFESNVEGDIRVSHGLTDVGVYLHEAQRKYVRRVQTPKDERVSLFLEGLPGNTGLVITYTVEPEEPMLRVEVEPLPTGTPSRVKEANFPGVLSWHDAEPLYTVWPNSAGVQVFPLS